MKQCHSPKGKLCETSALAPKSAKTKLRTTRDNANDTVVTSRVTDKSGLDIELGHHNMTTQGCWLDQHINYTTCTHMYPPTHALTHPHTRTLQLRTKSPGTKCLESLVDPPTRRFAGVTDPNPTQLMMHIWGRIL